MNRRNEDTATLGRLAVFEGVAPQTLADLAANATTRRWAAGQFLFQRGDADDCLLAIMSGQVRLSLMTPGGRELVLKVLGQGDVLGEFAVIDGLARSTDAVALQPVTAMVVTRDQFLRVAQARPDLPMAFARYLCTLLRATNFQMESIALYDLQGRLVRFILMVIRQAHGATPPPEVRIDLGLNQTDLAAALGATRPRVNNALQGLIALGAIQRDGVAVLCNVSKLNALADEATQS
jgi:CRP/FNR family transcriptional regulator, cyclic AMP receptor protein